MPHPQLSTPVKAPHKASPVWLFNRCYFPHPHTNSPFKGLFYIFLVGPSGFNNYLLWSLQHTVIRLSFLNEILFLACCSAQEGRLINTYRIKSTYPSRYSIHTHLICQYHLPLPTLRPVVPQLQEHLSFSIFHERAITWAPFCLVQPAPTYPSRVGHFTRHNFLWF